MASVVKGVCKKAGSAASLVGLKLKILALNLNHGKEKDYQYNI